MQRDAFVDEERQPECRIRHDAVVKCGDAGGAASAREEIGEIDAAGVARPADLGEALRVRRRQVRVGAREQQCLRQGEPRRNLDAVAMADAREINRRRCAADERRGDLVQQVLLEVRDIEHGAAGKCREFQAGIPALAFLGHEIGVRREKAGNEAELFVHGRQLHRRADAGMRPQSQLRHLQRRSQPPRREARERRVVVVADIAREIEALQHLALVFERRCHPLARACQAIGEIGKRREFLVLVLEQHSQCVARLDEGWRIETPGAEIAVFHRLAVVARDRREAAERGEVGVLLRVARAAQHMRQGAVERIPAQVQAAEKHRIRELRGIVHLHRERAGGAALGVAVAALVAVAQREIQHEAIDDPDAAFGHQGLEGGAVLLGTDGGDIEAGRVPLVVGDRAPGLVVAAREPGRIVEGAERAALGAQRQLHRALAALGDDVDDAAERIGAVETALRAADHLDTLDVLGREIREIEQAVVGVVGDDAVDDDEGMVGLGAADAHRRQAAEAAGAADRNAGQAAQRVGGITDLLAAYIVAGDDADRRADGIAGVAVSGGAGARRAGAGARACV